MARKKKDAAVNDEPTLADDGPGSVTIIMTDPDNEVRELTADETSELLAQMMRDSEAAQGLSPDEATSAIVGEGVEDEPTGLIRIPKVDPAQVFAKPKKAKKVKAPASDEEADAEPKPAREKKVKVPSTPRDDSVIGPDGEEYIRFAVASTRMGVAFQQVYQRAVTNAKMRWLEHRGQKYVNAEDVDAWKILRDEKISKKSKGVVSSQVVDTAA